MRKVVGIVLSVIQILLAVALILGYNIFVTPIRFAVDNAYYETAAEFNNAYEFIYVIDRLIYFANYAVLYSAIIIGVLGIIFLIMFITEKKLTK